MFKKILVALDSKETCDPLMEKAIALAQAVGAQLKLITVLSLDSDGRVALPQVTDSTWNIYKERYQVDEATGLAMLRQFKAQALNAGVSADFEQVIGNPGRLICEAAEDWSAELILVGSHGRRGLSELLLGSVSSYVMHHAPCSVLVVHRSITQSSDANAPATST